MKKHTILTIAVAIMTGCATHKPTPTVHVPETPSEFFVSQQKPGDQNLSCDALSAEFRYGQAYGEAINRSFNVKAPTRMTSPTYTSTSGMATRHGNTTFGNVTSTTYGGGSVLVYDTLTGRAMEITDSVSKRLGELRRLAQRRGDCSTSIFQTSQRGLEELKRKIEDTQRSYERNKEIYSSYEKKADTENWSLKDRQYQKNSFQQSLREEQMKIEGYKTTFQALLKDHQSLYERSEVEAQSRRKWFDDNTKTVMK